MTLTIAGGDKRALTVADLTLFSTVTFFTKLGEIPPISSEAHIHLAFELFIIRFLH